MATASVSALRFISGTTMAALLSTAGCNAAGDDHDGFNSEEWKAVQEMQPLATEAAGNPFNNRATDVAVAKFAQRLFYETLDMSEAITVDGNPAGKKGETGKVGCMNCHDPAHYFADSRIDPTTGTRTALSAGLGAPGKRQAPAFMNAGYYPWAGWTGKFDSLVMHGAGVMESSATRLAIAHHLYKKEKFRNEYNGLFPTTPLDPALDVAAPDAARFPATGRPKANEMAADGPWEKMTPDDQKSILQLMYNLGRLWDTYPRALVTHGSPFERYVTGDTAALGPQAKRGLKLFIGKAACNDCHNGPILSDGGFHNIGVSGRQGVALDMGRQVDLATTASNPYNGASQFSDDREAGIKKLATLPAITDAMMGQFRTPTLLNIAETGPYYHTGLIKTLTDVVQHYNKGGDADGLFAGVKDPKIRPLQLAEDEVSDLVAFLETLTAPSDESWTRDNRAE